MEKMKPYIHARIAAKRWGGVPEDYLPIHDFMDSSKACLADVRHRALLHSTFGCFIVEQVFGHNIVNSDGKSVSVRDIAENHVLEDLGKIPTVEQWLGGMKIEPWMSGTLKKRRKKEEGDIDEDDLVD